MAGKALNVVAGRDEEWQASHGLDWSCMATLGTAGLTRKAPLGFAGHGTARQARLGTVRQGEAKRGKERHGRLGNVRQGRARSG